MFSQQPSFELPQQCMMSINPNLSASYTQIPTPFIPQQVVAGQHFYAYCPQTQTFSVQQPSFSYNAPAGYFQLPQGYGYYSSQTGFQAYPGATSQMVYPMMPSFNGISVDTLMSSPPQKTLKNSASEGKLNIPSKVVAEPRPPMQSCLKRSVLINEKLNSSYENPQIASKIAKKKQRKRSTNSEQESAQSTSRQSESGKQGYTATFGPGIHSINRKVEKLLTRELERMKAMGSSPAQLDIIATTRDELSLRLRTYRALFNVKKGLEAAEMASELDTVILKMLKDLLDADGRLKDKSIECPEKHEKYIRLAIGIFEGTIQKDDPLSA